MPDSGYPNLLSVDALGRAQADFSGHVHASGLDMLAAVGGPNPTPPNDRRVRWLREADGTLVASLFGYDGSGGSPAYTRGLWAEAGPAPSVAAGTQRLLLDENSQSGFMEAGDTFGKQRMYWGEIPGGPVGAGAAFGPLAIVIVGGFGTPFVTLGVRDFGGANQITLSSSVVSSTNVNVFGRNLSAAGADFRVTYHIIFS